MRRRAEPDPSWEGVPGRLLRFDPEEWTGADDLERAGAWWAAREAWALEHGETAPLDWDTPIPDAPFDQRAI